MKTPVKIILWGQEVGQLTWDSRRHNSYFTFSRQFLEAGHDLAPLIAPIGRVDARLPKWGLPGKFQNLPSFLADSLPDDWGNQLFDQWRRENRLPDTDSICLEKLSFIGSRGMGALEFVPAIERQGIIDTVNVGSLVNLARKIMTQREEVRILPEEELTMQALIHVGTSAGGRQPKALVSRHRDTGEMRSGQIECLTDYDYHILKFGDANRSSAELEMTYYLMAKFAGINISPSELVDIEGERHFLTKRFDRREDGDKLHVQTLAALWPESDSYETLLQVCRRLGLPESDVEEVYRRMVFNVLSNNTDDHNKNFSFIMDRSGCWSLAPAYDVTFIFNRGGYQAQATRCLSIRGKLENITRDDCLKFASDNGIKNALEIIESVIAAITEFPAFAANCGVKVEWQKRVSDAIESILNQWHERQEQEVSDFAVDGHSVQDFRIEQAYKGNYHLYAIVDGRPKTFILRNKQPEHVLISMRGIGGLTAEDREFLIRKFINL